MTYRRENYAERELEKTPFLQMVESDLKRYGIKWVVTDRPFKGYPMLGIKYVCDLLGEESDRNIQRAMQRHFDVGGPGAERNPTMFLFNSYGAREQVNPDSSRYFIMYKDGKFFTYDDKPADYGFESRQVVVGAMYKHYKGKVYQVVDVAQNAQTGEQMVVYEQAGETRKGKMFVLPLQLFLGKVEEQSEGKVGEQGQEPKYRFERMRM